jgi:hypothetical protein
LVLIKDKVKRKLTGLGDQDMSYEIKKLDLEKEDVSPYLYLVETDYQCYLYRRNPYQIQNVIYLAYVAFEHQQPIGILLASVVPLLRAAELHYLHIKNLELKIALTLLRQLKEDLSPYNCLYATFLYPCREGHTHFFETVLAQANWAPSQPFMERYFFHRDSFNPPWLHYVKEFPKEFEIFPWRDLTPAERRTLHVQTDQYTFDPMISPLIYEKNLEHINSLGLRYKGKLVGWVITSRMNEETIRYSALYIAEEFQRFGYIIKLLSDSIELQRASKVPVGMFEINLKLSDTHWKSFIKKRLTPYASRVVEIQRSWIDLRN